MWKVIKSIYNREINANFVWQSVEIHILVKLQWIWYNVLYRNVLLFLELPPVLPLLHCIATVLYAGKYMYNVSIPMVKQSGCLDVWLESKSMLVRFPAETYIFILNSSLVSLPWSMVTTSFKCKWTWTRIFKSCKYDRWPGLIHRPF